MSEDAKSLNVLLRELEDRNNELHKLYKRYRNWFVTILILQAALTGLLSRYMAQLVFNHRYFGFLSLVVGVGIIFQMVLVLLRLKVLSPKIRDFKSRFTKAVDICSAIVDRADWTTFRLRNKSDNKWIQVYNVVGVFYALRDKRFFPSTNSRSNYLFLNIYSTPEFQTGGARF